eukprot:1110098-Rhodomonas_salina.1
MAHAEKSWVLASIKGSMGRIDGGARMQGRITPTKGSDATLNRSIAPIKGSGAAVQGGSGGIKGGKEGQTWPSEVPQRMALASRLMQAMKCPPACALTRPAHSLLLSGST